MQDLPFPMLALPNRQKIGVRNVWVRERERLERNANDFGCELWA